MKHYLYLVSVTEAGSRYDCLTCGRIVIIEAIEPYKKRVLIAGDEAVTHYGSIPEMQIEAIVEEVKGD